MPRPLPELPHELPGRSDYRGFDYTAPRPDLGTRRVYVTGPANASGVLLLHELPGLAAPTVGLADRLVAAGYHVFLPLLVGEPMREAAVTNYRQLCVSQEFARLRANVTAPITGWLRALAADSSAWCDDGAVGAIGMCLTGGFVIPLMIDPVVGAPVTSQPSIPIAPPWITGDVKGHAINVSDADLDAAASRARRDDVTLLGLRFRRDWKCPPQRFEQLRGVFGERLEAHVYDPPRALWPPPWEFHSVLTYAYPDAGCDERSDHPSCQATRTLLAFLARRLRTAGTP